MKNQISKLLFSVMFISHLSPSAFAAGSGTVGGGGTATIKCTEKGATENTPLEALSEDFGKIPGSEKFNDLLSWYDTRLPNLSKELRKITNKRLFHWSLVPNSCEVTVEDTRPVVPFAASYGVFYNGSEGMVIQKNFPINPKLQLVALLHESVRFSFCDLNEVCTRLITESILDKYINDHDISAAKLGGFLFDNVLNEVTSSNLYVQVAPNGYADRTFGVWKSITPENNIRQILGMLTGVVDIWQTHEAK